MSETKFTPGPWVKYKDDCAHCGGEWGVMGFPGGYHSPCSNESDADLISAAPDLHEALHNVMLEFGPGTMSAKAFEDACNALRKARGETCG